MQIFLSLLMGVLLIFVLEHAVTSDLFDKLNVLSALDWLALFAAPILLICALHLYRRYKGTRLSQYESYSAAALAATVSMLPALSLFKAESSLAILISAYTAGLGWLFTNYNSIRNQRKSHTMTVLIQLRNSTEYHKHRQNVFRKNPMGMPLTRQQLQQMQVDRANPESWTKNELPTIESMTFILNYFEFMSIGVWNEDLDSAMIKESMRGIFVQWHKHLIELIKETQSRHPRSFLNFTNLVALYAREDRLRSLRGARQSDVQ